MSVAEVLHAIWLAYWEIFGLNLLFLVYGVAFLVFPVLFIGAVVIDLALLALRSVTTTPTKAAKKSDVARWCMKWNQRAKERWQRRLESDAMTE